MNVSKNKVTLLAAAIATVFASAAQAQVDMDAPAGAVPAARYAQEIRGPLTVVQAAANSFKSQVGFGFTTLGAVRFMRVDLTNARFVALPTALNAVVVMAGVDTTVAFGGTNASFVIVQLTPTALTPANTVFTFNAVGNYSIQNFDGPVVATYRLYETAATAQNAPEVATNVLYRNAATIFNVAPAFRINNLARTDSVSSSGAAFLRFTSGLSRQSVGAVNLALDTSNTPALGGSILDQTNTAVALGTAAGIVFDQTATGTTLSVAGDFTATGAAATNVRLSALGGVCPADPATAGGATAVTATSASFATSGTPASGSNPIEANAIMTQAGAGDTTTATQQRNVCFYANGTTAIPASDYVASYNVVPTALYRALNYGTKTIGRITRDGTELQSPWFSISTGYVSRFFVTNTSAVPFTCSVRLIGETGNTLTAGATTVISVPANGVAVATATEILSAASVSPRAAAIFSCNAPSTSVQGAYVLTNTATGAVANTGMKRPGTN